MTSVKQVTHQEANNTPVVWTDRQTYNTETITASAGAGVTISYLEAQCEIRFKV